MKVIKEKKAPKNKNDSMDIENSVEKLKVKSRIPDFTGLSIPKSLKYTSQSPSNSQSSAKDTRDNEALKSSPKCREISKKSSIPVLRRNEVREYEDINPRNEARRSYIPLQRSTRGSADDLRPPSTPTRIFSNNNSNIINNNYQLEKESSPSLIPKLLLLQKNRDNKRAKFNIEKVNMDVEDFASSEDKNKADDAVSEDKDQEKEEEAEEEEGSKDVKLEDDKDDEESASRRLSSHLSPEASPLSTRSSSRYSPRESESEPTPGLPRKIVAERSESLSSQRIRDAISRTRRESNSSARYESSGSDSIR